ncbi:protein TolR [Isoalcanivorax indicus]|uniref:protein TolR n=1 Tax=Isoalcanivorax indicus TaxID=2202653 RepID=UPI000DB9F602|nr:protein TolR [Isoalcanivorax indicus]
MIKVRAPRKLVAEINVVPYIDVMLVLLIVFMITAPMLTQGIQVDLPRTSSDPISVDDEPVIVSVRRDGGYYINIGENQQTTASLDTLRGHAQRIQRNAPQTLFLVEGDTQVPYGKIIELMAALQSAGIERLGLVTEPPDRAD